MELLVCATSVGGTTEQICLFLTLYDSINDMKFLRTVAITPQPCHSHFCCWLLPIWPKLDFWAENGAYGLCRLGWRYNVAKLYFHWPYMIVSMIWNTSEISALHLRPATAISVVGCCQFALNWMFGLKMELIACAGLVGGTTEQRYLYYWPYMIVSMIFNTSETVPITTHPCCSHFCCWLLPIWP